jgi:SSS family transporter
MDYLSQHGLTLLLIAIYVGLIIYIGWHFQKRASQNVNEYYLANRKIPGWVVSLAFFSTFISTSTYIGQAGESFKYGLSWAYVALFWVVFCMISWLVMGPRMRSQSIRLKSVTVPDYFQLRYQSNLSKSIRVLSSFIILFATLWYMTGIAKGGANLLNTVLEVDYGLGAFILIFFTCGYTMAGGMYGVMWTDAIQGILMFLVAIIMLIIPFYFAGGYSPLMEKLANLQHVTTDGTPIGDGMMTFGGVASMYYIIAIGLTIGMKQVSDPKLIIRFYSIKDKASMKFAMTWTPIFLGISLICVMCVGALVHVMVSNEEAAYLINNTDEVVGVMFNKLNNPTVSGICMMGLFAAGMSSLASVTFIAGTSIVKDIWNIWKPMEEQKIVRRTKWAMLGYCTVVFLFTLYPPAGVVEMSSFAGSVFAASFFPTIFGGLYLRWGTDIGALSSMVAGMVVNVIWRFGIRFNFEGMEQVHEVFPAFVVSFLVYVVASKLTTKRMPESEHLRLVFDDRK